MILLALLAETFVAASHVGAMAAAGSTGPVELADGSRLVVICTGDSIKRVRVGADGQLVGEADVDPVPGDAANMCFMVCMVHASVAITVPDFGPEIAAAGNWRAADFLPDTERKGESVRYLFAQTRAPPPFV